MDLEFKRLLQDTLAFIKEEKQLPYSDAFFIKGSVQKKQSFPKKPVAILPKIKEKPKPAIKEPEKVKGPPPVVKREKKQAFIDKAKNLETVDDDFLDIVKQVQQLDPTWTVLSELPDDTKAKKIARKWKYQKQACPVSLFFIGDDKTELSFFHNIAKAIDIYFMQAGVVSVQAIEKENTWDEFLENKDIQLIIACDDQIWRLSNLMLHYKEVPNQSLKTLGKIPLFLIPNLNLYFKDPNLKRSLWKAICKTISNIQ